MTDSIAITGLVATDPRHIVTAEGLPITTFRLASTQRRYDRTNQKWIDGDTNWYTISSFRQLAINASGSVRKGERVMVVGRLRIREWKTDERTGMTVDVEAEAIGHDLAWGHSVFTRSIHGSGVSGESTPDAPENDGGGSSADDQDDGETNEDARPMATLPF